MKLLRAFIGKRELPIYEFPMGIRTPHAHVGPLPQNPKVKLRFSGMKLSHAAKKADFLLIPNLLTLSIGSLSFFIENFMLFDWESNQFRLKYGMSHSYTDFVSTSLAGRIA